MIYHVLFHVGADDAATSHLDLDGLCQDPTSQRLHGSGEGGRKHDCLTVRPHVVHNAHHLVEEPQHFTVDSVQKHRTPKGHFNNNELNYSLFLPMEANETKLTVSSVRHPSDCACLWTNPTGSSYLWLKTHVKHPVRFIQHHVCDSAQVGDST